MGAMLLLIFCSFLYITVKDSVSNDILSYLQTKQDPGNSKEAIHKELEEMFLKNNYFLYNAEENDLLCMLSNSKKIALCELIFNLEQYKTINDVALNKTALYLQKLFCEEKELTIIEYVNDFPVNKNPKQEMYSCPARNNKIIRTSFIEDNLYDTYYLSAGPAQNSILVYSYKVNEFTEILTVYDYICNVDLSKLPDMSVTVKEAVNELKLNKGIYASHDYEDAEVLYVRGQNYANNYSDPVCDLEYEKKISLCKIAFNQFDIFDTIINKGAFFLLSTKCINVPVYKFSTDNEKLLTNGHNLCPCFGRFESTTDENFLQNELIEKIYLSSGYKRNSVFVYFSVDLDNFNVGITLIGIMDNIDFRILKPTKISLEDVKLESESTYNSVLDIMTGIEFNLSKEIELIAVQYYKRYISFEKECKLIEVLENKCVGHFFTVTKYKDDSQSEESDYTEKSSLEDKINNEQQQVESKTELSCTNKKNEFQATSTNIQKDAVQIGAQIFKFLIDKKKKEIEKEIATKNESKVTIKSIRRKLEKIKLRKDVEEKQKLSAEVQNLIEKMQLYINTHKSQHTKKTKYKKKSRS